MYESTLLIADRQCLHELICQQVCALTTQLHAELSYKTVADKNSMQQHRATQKSRPSESSYHIEHVDVHGASSAGGQAALRRALERSALRTNVCHMQK